MEQLSNIGNARESYKKADDEELVRASLSGDKLAFSEIVNRYRKMVARLVKGNA